MILQNTAPGAVLCTFFQNIARPKGKKLAIFCKSEKNAVTLQPLMKASVRK